MITAVTTSFVCILTLPQNAPVTMVTSVPWKRERDITEITPLWENSFPPTFPEDLLAHASQWLANCREACKYDELERQYKCSARDNTSESELNAAWLN